MKTYNVFSINQIKNDIHKSMRQIDGEWVCARPMRYKSFVNRLKMAWLVMTDKADCLIWPKQ